MCYRLSPKYGYICDECFEELVYRGPRADVDEFLESCKLNIKSAKARFEAEFPRQDEDWY